jgi:hypothetical protein
MNVVLLAPLGLAALAALALPILLHLIRRLELTTTEFAALRWISDRVRPRRRIRIERPWLLLLRLALLAALALLLAKPVFVEPAVVSKAWVVVAPGIDRGVARAAVSQVGAEWHWLAPGFPRFDGAEPSADVPLASLLREADAALPRDATLSAIIPTELAGLDGERPLLAHEIDWHVVPGRMVASPAPSRGPVRFAVRYAPEAEPSLVYLRAAVAAWNTREPGRYTLDAQPLDAPIPDDERWLAWLAPQVPTNVSAWIDHGGIALLTHQNDASADALWRDAQGDVLARVEPRGSGRAIELPHALSPADLPLLLDADFPDRLLAALQGPPAPPTRAMADAVRPKQIDAASGATHLFDRARPLDPWLVVLIALLFLVERVVATWPRRQVSA